MTTHSQRLFEFIAGDQGAWLIRSNLAVVGDGLPAAQRLSVLGHIAPHWIGDDKWRLQGVVSNDRYVTRPEKLKLIERQPKLGRLSADCGAFIGLRKNAAWWALTQDERREIIEDQSHHISMGMRFLPAIARRLFHCRDLACVQPFDFLTWFEYSAEDEPAFDDLVALLRASAEWRFIEREVDLRLLRANP